MVFVERPPKKRLTTKRQTVCSYLRSNGAGNNQNTDMVFFRNTITDAQAVSIKNTLEKIKLHSTKVKHNKAVLRNKCLTVSQIKMLVLLFNNTYGL